MKIKRHLIDSVIIYKGSKFKVEDTEEFYKIAKQLGFDVFSKIKPSKEKRDKIKVEIKADIDARDNESE